MFTRPTVTIPTYATAVSGVRLTGPAMTPLLLLDVDGVLNAVTLAPDEAVWPDWRTGTADANGRTWTIRWSPTDVARLLHWHEQGLVELQWLTTWGHHANVALRQLLGAPELAVAGTHDEQGSASDLAAPSLAQVTAAAPDELTGRWWKLDVVRRVVAEEPDRPVIWVDDELRGSGNPYADWARGAGIVAVGPQPDRGLDRADLEVLQRALASPGSAGSPGRGTDE